MKALEEIKEKLKEIEDLKVIAKNDIINDENTSKLEKLTLLRDNDMLGVCNSIAEIFPDWEDESIHLEMQAAIDDGKDPEKDYICTITDDMFCNDNYDRHQTVDLVSIIENISWDNEDLDKDTMVVIRNRGKYKTNLKKTINEVIDVMYDWCIETNQYGFVMDW
jgi:hypothetical protein